MSDQPSLAGDCCPHRVLKHTLQRMRDSAGHTVLFMVDYCDDCQAVVESRRIGRGTGGQIDRKAV